LCHLLVGGLRVAGAAGGEVGAVGAVVAASVAVAAGDAVVVVDVVIAAAFGVAGCPKQRSCGKYTKEGRS
jgi:hypothetical protein